MEFTSCKWAGPTLKNQMWCTENLLFDASCCVKASCAHKAAGNSCHSRLIEEFWKIAKLFARLWQSWWAYWAVSKVITKLMSLLRSIMQRTFAAVGRKLMSKVLAKLLAISGTAWPNFTGFRSSCVGLLATQAPIPDLIILHLIFN